MLIEAKLGEISARLETGCRNMLYALHRRLRFKVSGFKILSSKFA
jgi:hypothetical protein